MFPVGSFPVASDKYHFLQNMIMQTDTILILLNIGYLGGTTVDERRRKFFYI